MVRKLTILKEAPYYKYPVVGSRKVGVLQKGQYLNFTREKRRDGKNWYGVILTDGVEFYIDKKNGFPWEKAEMIDSGLDFYGNNEEISKMIKLPQGEKFFITHPYTGSSVYKIINKEGYEGLLSTKYNIDVNGLFWFQVIAGIISVSLFVIILLAMIVSGFIVFSGLMIPIFGIIGVFIAGLFFASFLLIKELFNQIVKRL